MHVKRNMASVLFNTVKKFKLKCDFGRFFVLTVSLNYIVLIIFFRKLKYRFIIETRKF